MREQRVKIDYTNWRGERRERIVVPMRLTWEVNRWHGMEPQWIMYALDTDIGEVRGFAMSQVHRWETA